MQQPLQHGGLDIHSLETLGCALHIRWLWLQKTDPSRPWTGLPIQVPGNAHALFGIAVKSVVRNGESTKFWSDRWPQRKTVLELAPKSEPFQINLQKGKKA